MWTGHTAPVPKCAALAKRCSWVWPAVHTRLANCPVPVSRCSPRESETAWWPRPRRVIIRPGRRAVDPTAQVELALRDGPFCHALTTAVRSRGLTLRQLQYRLRARGVAVSAVTLSYWQSGRSRPER